jgi:trehalose/maltose transport system substrate-binding protein
MKKSSLGIVASLLGLTLSAQAVEISIACGGVGDELSLCQEHVGHWAKKTGHTVTVIEMRALVDDQLGVHQHQSEKKSTLADVIQIDIIWPRLLADDLIDLSPYVKASILEQHFPAIVEANRVKGKLVGIPWFTDLGILFYRKDLLKTHKLPVPKTWAELARTAKTIQEAERQAGNPKMWGFVWQGRAYEGLTCDALEWIASYGGGSIVNEQGQSTVYNPQAIKAINNAAKWIGTISPPEVLNYAEEETREKIFEKGNAVFMRHWPRTLALSQKITSLKGNVGVAMLPKGGLSGQHASSLGGWQLSVSKYSKHPKTAADLIRYLTSKEVQKKLPYHQNKVTLDRSRTDKWGLPVLAIDAELKENELKMRVEMKQDAVEILEAAGFKNVHGDETDYALGMGIHEMGTARMGTSPNNSVLNKWNQVWDAPNVFVTDGAAMTSASCVNPSLTYMAITARAADYAVNELKKRNL